MKGKYIIFIALLVLIVSISAVSANDLNETDAVSDDNLKIDNSNEKLQSSDDFGDSKLSSENDEVVVSNWAELQYYCSLNDDNYTLRLKENTNFYPDDPSDSSYQIIVRNNVRIIGSDGSYIGDASSNFRNITFTAINVQDNSGIGISIENVTFKWIGTSYRPDGVFLCMGGNAYNHIKNCYFADIITNVEHSAILHIKSGDALVENCTFVNCTTDFGCISIYNPLDDSADLHTRARMELRDSYFEGNYAKTASGCINNAGILTVRNSTFHMNSAFWWAGAIHTVGGANTTIYDSTFTDNVAGWNGGALYTYSYLQIYNSTFNGNNCTTNNGGGAIGACNYLHSPYIYIDGCIFENNENLCWGLDELSTTGTGRGGAISIMDTGGLEVYNSIFIKNSASIGSAICAIATGSYGSPNIVIKGNKFINHTRIGDVLNIRVEGSGLLIADNYYYNNSIPFSKLRLIADDPADGIVTLHVDASLENARYYESDILDKSEYDVYVDGEFAKRILGKTFTLDIEDGEIHEVYIVPCISTSRSNSVLIGKEKEYIYLSKKGADTNDGLTRLTPVLTIRKAIELAHEKGNIIIMDGTYDENNLTVNYDLTIIGEDNVIIKGKGNIFIVNDSFFTIKNLTFKDASRTTQTVASNGEIMIQQVNKNGFFTIEDCSFISIDYKTIISSSNCLDILNSVFTQNTGIIIDSVSLNVHDSSFTFNSVSANALLYGTKSKDWNIINTTFSENHDLVYGVIRYNSLNSLQNLNIINSSFLSNSVKSVATVYSSGLYLQTAANINIKSSIFMDNIDRTKDSNLIYLYTSAAVNVRDSVFLNNRNDDNTYGIIFGGYRSLNSGTVDCTDNWFGNTLNNLTKPGTYGPVNMDEWLFLNVYSDNDSLGLNQKTVITFELNAVNGDGVVSAYDASAFPVIPLTLKTSNASLNVSSVDLVNGKAQAEFTLTALGDTYVTAQYHDVEARYDISGVMIYPDIIIDAENVTYGQDAVILLTWPDDVSYDDMSIRINNVPYVLNEVITVPDLVPGIYPIELNYTGNYMYYPKVFTKEFEVYKADPQITIDVSDRYYGDDVEIIVNVNSSATGQITISDGNISQTKEIEEGKAIFTIQNLAANNYTVIARYEGDSCFNASQNKANFTVKKYNSTVELSYEIIDVENKAIINIEVNPITYGNITIHINHNGEIEEHTFDLINGKFTYDLNNLVRGDYQIDVIYAGNEKFLTSQSSIGFEVYKITPALTVTVANIEYGEVAIIDVALDNGASGNVTVSVDGRDISGILENSRISIPVSGLTAGNNKEVRVFYQGNQNYKNASTSALFNVSKITPSIVIDVSDVKVGTDVNIQFIFPKGVTGTVNVSCGSRKKSLNINSAMGLASWRLENLEADNYTVEAEYSGDSNYLPNRTSATFKVSDWNKPQWADSSNSKSPYESDANGEISWVSDVGGVIGNIVIGYDGTVFLTTADAVYAFDKAGNMKWTFSPTGADGNLSGIAIGRDVVISPKSADSIYFINQDDGSRFGHSNIYQASSQYAPIIDDNSNIYISGEYQYATDDYNLVILPYSIWENGGGPVLISLGKSRPVSSPTLVGSNIVAVACDNSLKIININTKSIVSSISGNTNGVKPVVGSGDIIYAVLDDSIVSLDKFGNQIWKTKVSGGVGKSLAIDEEQNLYAVNSKGNLYSYNLISGEETLLSTFEVSSGILIGSDGRIFVASENLFYALDYDGNELWKVDVGERIIGNPVMDNEGTIYLASSNKIYAMVNAPLKESNLNVACQNITEGKDETIIITLDDEATGEVAIRITGDSYSNESTVRITASEIILTISDLNAGLYDVEVQYMGDERFKSDTVSARFTVSGKKNTTILISELSVEKLARQYMATLVDGDGHYVSGVDLTLFVNGQSYGAVTDSNGIATFNFALGFGKYPLKVEFAGNGEYNPSEAFSSINVMDLTSIQITVVYGDCRIVSILKDSRGNGISNARIKYSLNNGEKFSVVTDENGEFTVQSANNCLLTMEFEGNELYKSSDAVITLKNINSVQKNTIIEVPINFQRVAVDYNAGETGTMFYFTLKDSDGNPLAKKGVKIGIFDKIYTVKTDNAGKAGLQINIANANYYTYGISFLGDDEYKASFAVCCLQIVKKPITITPAKTSYSFKATAKTKTITATLKSSNSYIPKGKQVTLTIAGKTFKTTIGNNGQINFNIGSVTKKGTYKVTVNYAGSNTYNAANSKVITVKIT